MGNSTDWYFKLVRIGAVNFPIAASLVQLQAEIDSQAISERLKDIEEKFRKFEDPISSLHPKIASLSKEIYRLLSLNDDDYLNFPDKDFYEKFSIPLNILVKNYFIKFLGSVYAIPQGIEWINPDYIIYMCKMLDVDKDKMLQLTETIERCRTLLSSNLKEEIGLPEFVIKAMFKTYEKKGYGEVYGANNKYRSLTNI